MFRTDPVFTVKNVRAAFTLIELLVVIAILGILMGITLPAIQRFRDYGPRLEARNDIAQLDSAIANFKSTYNVQYIPAGIWLQPTYNQGNIPERESFTYLKKVFGRAASGYTFPTTATVRLNGNQTLMFFLTGGPYVTPNPYMGFSPSSTNPLGGSGNRNLFMDIKSNKFNAAGEYIDPWGTPYAYFSMKNGNDFGSHGVYYGNSTGGYPVGGQNVQPMLETTTKFVNSHSHQIISAGKNRAFGCVITPNWTPGTGVYSTGQAGGDDLANFAQKMLSANP
ncbi:MAG: type II secretion system protein [Zavarzinella sp.]